MRSFAQRQSNHPDCCVLLGSSRQSALSRESEKPVHSFVYLKPRLKA